MSKKSTGNKRKQTACQKITTPPPQLVFTLPILQMLKASLATFEMLLLTNENTNLPNRALAQATFPEVKQKVTDMLEREEWGERTSFDYNELWIIYASMAMSIVEMRTKEKQAAELPICIILCDQVKALIDANKK